MNSRPFNPTRPPHPVTNPRPNPNNPSNSNQVNQRPTSSVPDSANQLVQHSGGTFNPNLPPDRLDNPHPDRHHPSNIPHPHLSPSHPRNDPNSIQNQPRFRGATDGATDPNVFAPIAIDVPATGNRDNPEVKVLQHEDKKIILSPDGIFLLAAGTTVSLTDEEGVTVISDGNISFEAGKEIMIGASGEINVVGMEGVELKTGIVSVEIDEDVQIEGNELKTN